MRFLITVVLLVLVVGALIAGVMFQQDINDMVQSLIAQQGAEQAVAEENWGDALALLEKAHANAPDNTGVSLRLGQLYVELYHRYKHQGGVQVATPVLQPAAAGEGAATSDASSTSVRTRWLSSQGMADSATAILNTVTRSPRLEDTVRARLLLGGLLQEKNQFKEAILLYREALAQFQSAEPKTTQRSEALRADVLAALGNAFKLAGDNPDEQRTKLKSWLYDWSVYYYRQALQVMPRQFAHQFNLGVVYQVRPVETRALREQYLVKAIRQYCNARYLAPSRHEVYYNLGLALVDYQAVEPGFRKLSDAVTLLSEGNHIQQAQQLAQQIQTVKNNQFLNSASSRVDESSLDPWMQQCVRAEVPSAIADETGEAKKPPEKKAETPAAAH